MLVSVDTKVDVLYKDGGVSMKGVPQGRYTKEFREEAVRLIIEDGLSLPDVGRRLSLPPSTLGNWVKAHKEGKLTGIGATRKPLTNAETELARVRRELATVKMERDILKKATAYFARESLPGTRS